MRIGLARHFPVSVPWPSGWRTSAELQAWRERYDIAEVNPFPVPDETPNWSRCYTSDLPRAETTARTMFRGEVTPVAMVREGTFGPFPTGGLRLPVWMWHCDPPGMAGRAFLAETPARRFFQPRAIRGGFRRIASRGPAARIACGHDALPAQRACPPRLPRTTHRHRAKHARVYVLER